MYDVGNKRFIQKQTFMANFFGSDYYDMESMVHADTRSFILKKPKLSEEIVVAPNQESGMKTADTLRVLSGHLMQTR